MIMILLIIIILLVISLLPKITNKYAIKTGTTDTDNWIIGYNKNLLVGFGLDMMIIKMYSDDSPILKIFGLILWKII